MTAPDDRSRLARLTLADKVGLLTGQTAWRLTALPQIGLRSMVLSDGPAGVRGTEEIPGETSLSFACPSALAATWDADLARRIGRLFAREARRHGVDVVLAPIVNLQRTPVGGRHFENLSEDPLLTGDIACAFLEGCQAEGVGVCVKHFLGNESETRRMEYIATIDERTLREVYLAPFERACRDAGAWSVMASYNLIDDGTQVAPAVAPRHLLTDVLKGEWGYDGPVVSDWTATKTAKAPALGGLDLVMPGPGGPWSGGQLEALVASGEVPEEYVDDKVVRLLRLARRVGALGEGVTDVPSPCHAPALEEADWAGLRALAGRSIVVLKDDDRALPWPGAPGSIALIGPNAVATYVQGGGSCHVKPSGLITPAQALADAFPQAVITVEPGATSAVLPPTLEPAAVTNPATGATGAVHLRLTDRAGHDLAATDLIEWSGAVRGLPDEADWAHVSADITLDEPGTHWLGLGSVGVFTLSLDGDLVQAGGATIDHDVFIDSSIHRPPVAGRAVEVGTSPRRVRLDAGVEVVHDPNWDSGYASLLLLHQRPEPSPADRLAAAVAAAARAEAVVVIVGTNEQVESEGWDRTDLDLPGDQNALVEAVLEVRPDAVVAVNAGAPVILPWLEQARTVLWMWFPGQMGGAGLADVLAGRTEPSGRLPWTLPAAYADVPVPNGLPDAESRVRYAEGRDVGYRGWLRLGRRPARPFGYGLGWTTWRYDDLTARAAGDGGLEVALTVTNAGPRAGRETVQVYLADPADETRPRRWLAGCAGVDVAAGASQPLTLRISPRQLEIWDVARHAWTSPATTYRVLVAHDLDDVRAETTVTVPGRSSASPGPTLATPACPTNGVTPSEGGVNTQ